MTYSLDLINASINYYKVNNQSLRSVSNIFGVSKSSLNNWSKNLPLKYIDDPKINIKIKPEMIKYIKNSLNQNPYKTQIELLNKLNCKFNSNLSLHHVKTILKILNYTKKKAIRKLYNKNLKEHICNKSKFKKLVKKLDKSKIICLDEVSIDRNTYELYGYCHKSKRLKYNIDINKLRLKKSLIVAIDVNEVIKYKCYDNKNINSDLFIKFIEELCSKVNDKIILMDNVSFHKSKKVFDIINKSNNEILFIPPYSPEFNPIEKVFYMFKTYINKKVNVITNYLNLNKHINDFMSRSKCFINLYIYSFG